MKCHLINCRQISHLITAILSFADLILKQQWHMGPPQMAFIYNDASKCPNASNYICHSTRRCIDTDAADADVVCFCIFSRLNFSNAFELYRRISKAYAPIAKRNAVYNVCYTIIAQNELKRMRKIHTYK